MSDVSERPFLSNASEVDEAASDWLERRNFGSWTEEDRREFDDWFESSLAHRIAFVRLESGWKRTERLTALQSPTRSDSRLSTQDLWLKFFRLTAAVLFVAAVGSGVAFYLAKRTQSTYTTGTGEREVLSLADGSQIELNTETSLRTAVASGGRTVWLDKGEAYFRIKHDAAHPFVVLAGERRLTDIGTEFTVRRDSERLKVAVLAGNVRFEGDNSRRDEQKPAILKSGDTIVATATSFSISREPLKQLANELGWRRGVLIFNQTPLSEAADEINRYNRKKLVIADSAVGRLKIGGTFPKNNVNAITAAVRELFGLRVEDRGDEIVVSR
jgi:transmembrane sensor